MKIYKVENEEPKVSFFKKGSIKLTNDWQVKLFTDEGVFRLTYEKDSVFDGCSAPWFLRWMLPKYGNASYSIAWLVHDHLFDSHGLSFEKSNEVFYLLLRRAGLSKRKASLAKFGVSTKIGRNHYENKRDTVNNGKLEFYWDSK